ncbi:MAG: FecR domain-containing protein [Burkholderiales bacterium]|nr:FecR domain-containing protein [Burkholderiales bacterium]
MKFRPIFLRAAVAAALAGAAGLAAAQAAPLIVGEATMVIGVAKLFSADGAARDIERGTAIRVGDRVETEAGGHVHFRFVDGGRLSIRPSSRMQVESYNHSAQQPALTAIKFRLDEGVVRSITGAWGEAARDRFRLNTPVAAIGVKGTDFVVKSDADKTTASVYTGAIILSPLVAGCAATLGPCQSGNEKLLSEEMKGQMLELSRKQSSPQLVPLVDLMAQNRRIVVASESAGKSEKNLGNDPGRQDMASDKSVVNESRSAVAVAAGNASTPVPATPLTPLVPSIPQLAWGRWDWVKPVDGDTLSRTFEEATQNGRLSTVGNGAFGLYRMAPDENALLQTTDASANFKLTGGVAQLTSAQGRNTVVDAVKVDGGSLSVDFSRATFATQLNVSNAAIGSNNIQANGTVRPNGVMLGQGGNAYVAGALSLDGKEAGYFFEKNLPAGNLSGITLWGR